MVSLVNNAERGFLGAQKLSKHGQLGVRTHKDHYSSLQTGFKKQTTIKLLK